MLDERINGGNQKDDAADKLQNDSQVQWIGPVDGEEHFDIPPEDLIQQNKFFTAELGEIHLDMEKSQGVPRCPV
ncbi:MAG: hypothetical protein UT95_C0003G0005 [Candidatus Curtissbacteria bacterium GW2011_GWB1_40_28]|nr:MAG: hypothetical protein UT95_C0003G0005 [Candidatus Curtissbacteria bacterium GW2011_GWB1_40_28]